MWPGGAASSYEFYRCAIAQYSGIFVHSMRAAHRYTMELFVLCMGSLGLEVYLHKSGWSKSLVFSYLRSKESYVSSSWGSAGQPQWVDGLKNVFPGI